VGSNVGSNLYDPTTSRQAIEKEGIAGDAETGFECNHVIKFKKAIVTFPIPLTLMNA
jgi:hypothetical protein